MRSRLGIGVLLALVGMLAAASPAAAVTDGHFYSHSFSQPGPATGLFGFGMGLAIDQSTGEVYVSEFENHRVLKYDAAGNFVEAWGYGVSDGQPQSQVCTAPAPCQPGISGTAPGQLSNPTGIAVDNSNSVNQGDVYIVDGPSPYSGSAPGAILKFNADGVFQHKIDGAESDSGVFQAIGWNGAVSVDDNGFVWVAGGPISKYSNESDNEFILGSEWETEPFGSWSIASNAIGSRLLVGGLTEGSDTPQIYSAGGLVVVAHLPCGGYFNGATTFDMASDNFFVGNGGEICEFTQKGVQVSRFGSGHQSGIGGLAVNETTGDVYVADFNQNNVSVYIPRIVPDVTTGDVDDLGRTTATLTGQVAPDPAGGGDVSDCHFELGTDTSYGTNVPCEQVTPYSASKAVTADLTGLSMETTYHYRLVASNSIDANPGADKTFTPHAVLGLRTDAPSAVTPTTATLNGSFDADDDGTHYYFEWGTDTSYGNTTAVPPGIDVGSTPGMKQRSAGISGLSSYTRYHYRIVAANSLGTSYGEDETLLTDAPDPPTIGATGVSDVGRSGATIHTVVNPDFGITHYTIEYGTNGIYGTEIPSAVPLDPDDTDHPIATNLSGLQPGTTYHFRVVAENFGGTTLGPDIAFTTLDTPGIASDEASAVTKTTANLSALINPKLSATTFHIEYGPTGAYGSATRESGSIGADDQSHPVSVPLSGLAPGTAYHFRIVASNGVGTTAGPDRVFNTDPTQSAPITSAPKPKCKPRFVRRKGRCVKRNSHKRGKHDKSRKTGRRGDHQ